MENEIRKVMSAFLEKWHQHKPAEMASFWMKDGDLITPWGYWGKGANGVSKVFEKEQTGPLRQSTLKNDITYIRIIDGKSAWVEGKACLLGGLTPDGKEMPPFHHHFIYLFVKDSDGQWKFALARAYHLLGPVKEVH